MAICWARRWCSSPAAWATTLPVLRLLGPVVVILTLVLLFSGVGLLLVMLK